VPLHRDRVPIDDLDGARPTVTRLVHGPWERLLRTSAHPLCQGGYVVSDLRLLLVEPLRVAGAYGRRERRTRLASATLQPLERGDGRARLRFNRDDALDLDRDLVG
jgi:hypothetical protein